MSPIQDNFLTAINSARVEIIPTDFDPIATRHLANSLPHARLFLLGEMHGVAENASIIYTLMKKFGIKSLALEWDETCRTAINSYLSTDKLDLTPFSSSTDGRITANHFRLLSLLNKENLLHQLILYDREYTGDWNLRDQQMAETISSASRPDLPVLVFGGSLHTLTQPFISSDSIKTKHPMGESLLANYPNLISGRIVYGSGDFYNNQLKHFKDSTPHSHQARFYLKNSDKYTYYLPHATAATVPLNI